MKKGGILMTLIFPICDKPDGPPFNVSLELIENLLIPVGFEKIECRLLDKEDCHQGRDGSGSWGAMSGLGRWRKI